MKPAKLFLFSLLLFSSIPFALVEWSSSATDAVNGRPVLVSGRAIFTSYDGQVYAFVLGTGALSWAYDTKGKITLQPELADAATVAVATSEGKIILLTSNDGRLVRDIDLRKAAPQAFTAGDGRLFVGFPDSVVAYDLKGKALWNSSFLAGTGQFGYGNGSLYFTSAKKLYSLSASNGAIRWAADADDSFLARPYESAGTVYVGTVDGKLHAFHSSGGAEKWSKKTGGWVMCTPAVTDKAVYFSSNDGYFYALDIYGQEIFRAQLPGGTWTQPQIYEGKEGRQVVFGASDGSVRALDAKTGKEAWSFTTYGKPAELASSGKSFIFGTSKGKIYSLSPLSMCGFGWPFAMDAVGSWPVEIEGRASAENGIDSVEVRAGKGAWAGARGKESWYAPIDFSGTPAGPVSVECRVRDSDGKADSVEFSSLMLIKSEAAPLQQMYLSAPSEVGANEGFTLSAKDGRGMELRNVKIIVGQTEQAGDSPFSVSLGRSGPVQISVEKPGFSPEVAIVTGRGGIDFATIVVVLAVVSILGYFLVGKRLLGRK